MITAENLPRHELIGLKVCVAESSNRSQVSLKGKIVDESYKMLKIQTANGEKEIPKEIATFLFTLPSGQRVKVDGRILRGRPEDRVKKKLRKW